MSRKTKGKKAMASILAATMIASGMIAADADSTTVSTGEFDESQIVLRFGVLSDIHMSGSWNIDVSKQKLDRAYTGLELMAGGNKLDAVFIDGDITDAMNSSGNMSSSIPKLKQNYIEIGNFRDITLAHFGNTDTKIIYANGNHDTAGGIALNEDKKADTTGFYSSKLFHKILSGYQWQTSVPDNASATDEEIAAYNKELLTAYDATSGENYEWFFGSDLYLGENGLDYGNRHVEVGGYHFLTIEPADYSASYSDETVTWLDETLAEITEAEPNKAVFVATHARVTNTIFGSLGSVSTQLVPTLNKYPQVILWGGHEHSALNRELAIWQDGFTAVDAGVVQYLYAADFGYNANSATPINGIGYGGYDGTEYRSSSQGEYVEVDVNGNVRIKRLDFYNSDMDNGEVKVIGKPWEILGTNADGSHLSRYTVAHRADGNTAPTFADGAKLDVTLDDNIASVTFPAASDDIRVISYFVTVEQDGTEFTKQELTSFYYDYADASELNDKTYTASNLKCPAGTSVIKVTAIDDYGATAVLSTEVEVLGEAAYRSVEFDLTKLNNSGYSEECEGALTQDVTFEGRSGIAKIAKSADNLNGQWQIIMNNHTAMPSATLSETPYMVIDYYYAHDTASDKAAASKMRWRFFIWGNNKSGLTKETAIVTNKWATAVIPLTDEIFAKDDYKIKQYKFDPFGTTALRDMDDNDALYISGIRFAHDIPEVFTETGVAYVSANGYIAKSGAKVSTTIADAMKTLGANGGTVYVKGDLIVTDAAQIEEAGDARELVTVKGYGDDLEARQANRIWFQKTDTVRATSFNGDVTYDEITLKAPMDEAGIRANKMLTLGENLLMEKTVKNNSDIEASGTKSIAFNFGSYYNQSGKNTVTVNGGSYDAVSSVYSWIPGNANTDVETEYTFNDGTFATVYGGTRNSAGGVVTVGKNTTYNFVGGTFGDVYTGHHQNGKSAGITRFNISGGSFKSVSFGSAGGSAEKSQAANTVVKIDGASDKLSGITLYQNAKLSKVNDTDKWIAIVNNAEGGKANFASDLNVDYMLKVYGGNADAVFTDGVLSGFTITADNGSAPIVNGTEITAVNGIYDLSAYEGKVATITFSSDLPKSRMQNFYWALQNKEKVNVAYLGGSVTWGSGASAADTYSWRARVGQWLKDTYGEDKINNINAAIGSTGSYFGSYRVNQDAELESDHTPDLLFVEFAINDIYDNRTKEQVDIDYESIILQAYKANPQIVILPVFTMDISIANNILTKGDEDSMYFAEQRAIAAHYGLDTMDVGKELVKVIAAEYEEQGKTFSIYDQYNDGTIWKEYITDACHPNDNGYKYYADTIIKYLNSQLNPVLATVSADEHADVVLPETYCKPLGLENHLKLNGHYISFKDAGFTKENFYGWDIEYTDGESGVGDTNGKILTSYNESTFAFTFKGTAVGFYNHGKPTSGKINYKVTATDDPSVTYSGATDLRKNYSVGLSYPGELITGLEDREWKVECIMKDGGDGIVADLRFIYINGDVSTVKPCAAPESYIPGLKAEWASVEFDLTTLNSAGYSAESCKGTLTHGETFDGRTGVSKLTKAADNMNSADEIIMNNTTTQKADLSQTPYMVIDYYYAHDTASDKAAAPKMRWRFFIKASNNKLIAKEHELVTNEWATAVIPLTDEDFAKDGNKIKQYKFDPFETTILRDLDDNDALYISGIRFVHDIPEVYTETGVAYVSPDGYIENVGAKISTSVADAMKTLGANGGTVYVNGDVVVTDAAQIEEAGDARELVTVKGYGDDLAARQANRIWFQKTGTVRETSFNGDITYDEITLKAPMDEAGIRASKMLTLGSNVLVEKTVKNNSSINAAGTKSISLNFGASYDQSGKNTVTVNGGSYDAVSAVYNWNPGNADTDVETEYTFNGGTFNSVYGGTRNSAGGVFAVKRNTTYNFVGGTFGGTYTGHYVNGKSMGITRFNVSGGTFTNGIVFGSAGAANSVVSKSQTANTVVKIDGTSDKLTAVTLSANDKFIKVNDTDKWIAIVNNAESGKVTFDSSLNIDYMLKVYGGNADAVFTDGVLSGFAITADNGKAPVVNGTVLADENGVYDLSAYEGKTTEIYFNELSVDPNYSEDGDQSNKLTVRGAQLRHTNGAFDLRFVAIMGRELLNNAKVKAPETSEDTAIGYGFVILPVELLGENELTKETSNAYTVPAVKIFRDGKDEDHIEYTVCVTGIAQENFNRYYAVRPYITYADDYGVQRTVYGECYKGASLYSVASMVSESDPLYNEVKENILDKVK